MCMAGYEAAQPVPPPMTYLSDLPCKGTSVSTAGNVEAAQCRSMSLELVPNEVALELAVVQLHQHNGAQELLFFLKLSQLVLEIPGLKLQILHSRLIMHTFM